MYDNILSLISNLEKVTMRLLYSNVYLRTPWMKMRLEHGLLIVIERFVGNEMEELGTKTSFFYSI